MNKGKRKLSDSETDAIAEDRSNESKESKTDVTNETKKIFTQQQFISVDETNHEEIESAPRKLSENETDTNIKSEFKEIRLICMLCSENYDLENYSLKSPVMSMSCFHSICKACVLDSIEKRRKLLKRNHCNTCPCPMPVCKSPNAFNFKSLNWNSELFKLYDICCKQIT